MKKYIIILAVLFVGASAFAQDNTKKVTHEQKGDLVEATYFYADGNIEQKGTFNKDGKLHGLWVSYDIEGQKVASGNYENGKKVGTWYFWNNETVKEVNFDNSRISKVVERDGTSL